jgi:hypothetical protein
LRTALTIGARLGRASLAVGSRKSLSWGAGVATAGLALALGLTTYGHASRSCDAADYACSGQRVATLFAVIALPVLAVLVVTVRASTLRRMPQYLRLHTLGVPRLTVVGISAVEALVVASPGLAGGGVVGGVALLALGVPGAVPLAAVAIVLSTFVTVAATSMSHSLREPTTANPLHSIKEAAGRVASILWAVSICGLWSLSSISRREDAFSSVRALWWILASVAAVLSLPSVVPMLLRLFGRMATPLVERRVSLRLAARHMQFQPSSLTRGSQVLAAGAAIAVAAQFTWIAVAATPSVDRVIVAQGQGPNLLLFASATPGVSGPAPSADVIAAAPFLHGTCEDGSCGVFVLPCALIETIAAPIEPPCSGEALYAVDGASHAPVDLTSMALDDGTVVRVTGSGSRPGSSGPPPSFLSDYYVTHFVTPASVGEAASGPSTMWLVLARPGVTGGDIIGQPGNQGWSQLGGLSASSIAEVASLQLQILGVAALALVASLVGLITLSFDNYAERRALARKWQRFGVPEAIGSRSFMFSQLMSAVIASVVGCATGAAVAWNLGYTTVDSVQVGSRFEPILLTVAICLVIMILNAASLTLGVRLTTSRQDRGTAN